MSKTVNVSSPAQFNQLLSASKIVVVDFYADWCGPCKAIAPVYEQLSAQLSRPGRITFTKVNTDAQRQIAQTHNISAMPTFLIFKQGRETTRIQGADGAKLQHAVKTLAAEASSADSGAGASSSSGADWSGLAVPRGYTNITDQVDVLGLDLLNGDPELGAARTLFDSSAPSSLASSGASSSSSSSAKGKKDWVESDTDAQLLLFLPFMSSLKIFSLHLTSLAPADAEDVARPKTLRLFANRAHNLGFEEAEDADATQELEIPEGAWDAHSGTAAVDLRFVKFQKCSSLVVFVVDAARGVDKTRLDRVRVVGEAGSKRDPGKLEKLGEES